MVHDRMLPVGFPAGPGLQSPAVILRWMVPGKTGLLPVIRASGHIEISLPKLDAFVAWIGHIHKIL